MDIYSLKTPLKLEEGNWMLIVTILEVYNSVFKKTNQNIRLANNTHGHLEDPETSVK